MGSTPQDITSSGGITQLYRVIDLINSGADTAGVKKWCQRQIATRLKTDHEDFKRNRNAP